MTTRQFLLSAWEWHPSVIAVCVAALGSYAVLMRFRFSGRSVFLLTGIGVFFLALTSPLHALADGYLFSAHMLDHLLLQLIVPPLLLLGIPAAALPAPKRRGLKWIPAVLNRPLLTWWLGLGAMWIWHLPGLLSASLNYFWVHLLQIASLLLMGTAFWWPIIGPWARCRMAPLPGVLYLFSACVGCTILGIALTFAPAGLYPMFLRPADPLGILPLIHEGWGLTPARDQQLGGLLMWVPPCFVYLWGIFALFARWYAGPDPELTAQTTAPGRRAPDAEQTKEP